MIKIPDKFIICVEIPGIVNNPENAIKSLGNLSGIEESLKNGSPIKLVFCQEDPYSHAIPSDFMKRSGILIKKTKFLNGRIKLEGLGYVGVVHQFIQMADFYFIPPEGFREKKTIHERINEEIVGNIFIPPAVFSKVTHPVTIKWTTTSSNILNEINEFNGNENETNEDFDEKVKSESVQYWNVVSKYSDETIPSSPLKISNTIKLDHDALNTLKELFDKQPLWLRPVIESKISTEISAWKKKLLFTQVCYNIGDGPWRACLCRLGYDPRKDPESRIYQTLDFRDPYLRKVMKEKKIGINNKIEENLGESILDWQFKVPPKRGSQLYQICNIEDNHIKKLVEETSPLQSCTRESGWFKKAVIDQIRELLSLKCQQMRQLEDINH